MGVQGGGPLTGTADELPEGRGHALIASICSAGAPCGMHRSCGAACLCIIATLPQPLLCAHMQEKVSW